MESIYSQTFSFNRKIQDIKGAYIESTLDGALEVICLSDIYITLGMKAQNLLGLMDLNLLRKLDKLSPVECPNCGEGNCNN